MNQSENLLRLTQAPAGRLLWEYSLPAVVGMVVMSLYNVIDRIFIGQVVGPDAIAGLAVTFPVMNLSAALGVVVGAGSTARMSISLGRGDMAGAQRIIGNALTLTFVVASVYLSLMYVFIDPILRAFGASDATLPYAHDFMVTVLPACLMLNLSFGFNHLMRASGYPVKAMLTMMLGAGINILLAPLFIYVLGWGIRGAALATDIAMTISAVVIVSHFLRRGSSVRFARGTFRLQRQVVMSIISIGAAPSLVNAAACIVNVIINRSLVAYGGDSAVATAGVFVTFTSLLISVVLGISLGAQPILGYNYGAGCYRRVTRVYMLAAAAATVPCMLGSVVGITMPGRVAALFTTDAALIASTCEALPRAVLAFSLVGIQTVSTTLFQSLGMASKSIFLSLSRQVIFLIPLLIILPGSMGLIGVWTSFPASDLLATLVTLMFVGRELSRLHRGSTSPSYS